MNNNESLQKTLLKTPAYSVSIPRHLLHLALPLILGNILQQFYHTIDALVVGRFADQPEFAAVGVAGSVMNLFLFAIVGACTGISVLLAQQYGSGEMDTLRTEHFLSLAAGLLATFLLELLGLLSLSPLLSLIHTPAAILPSTKQYLSIVLAGLPASFLYNYYAAMFRAVGKTTAPLLILTIGTMVNLLLDLLFVAGWHLGAPGAAFATILAQIVCAVSCLILLHRSLPMLRFARTHCRFDRELLGKTLRFAAVTAFHQTGLYIGKLLVQGAVNTAGTDIISAYTATTRIEGFANSFGDSGSVATSVLVAQNEGEGKHRRAREVLHTSLWMLFFLGLIMAMIMYVSASAASAFLLSSRSGTAHLQAVRYLKLISIFYVFCFTGNALAGYFDGIGKVTIPFLGAATHITMRVILSWLLIGRLELSAVALATGIGWIYVNLLWTVWYRRLRN